MWIRASATFSNRQYLNHCDNAMLHEGEVTEVALSYGREITNTPLAEQIDEPAADDVVVGVDDPREDGASTANTKNGVDGTQKADTEQADTGDVEDDGEFWDHRSLEEVDMPHAELLAEENLRTVSDLVEYLADDGDLKDIPRIGEGRSSNIKKALANL